MPGSLRPLAVLVVALGLGAPSAAGQAGPLGVSADGVTVTSASGFQLTLRPGPLELRDAGGRALGLIEPLPLPSIVDPAGPATSVETHPGVVESWLSRDGRLHHEVRIDAALLRGIAATDVVELAWERARAAGPPSQWITRVPASAWLDAGAPDPFVIDATALDAVLRRPPRADATADCPADLVVECDGLGNAADQAAWLDLFTGTASPGCGVITRSLEITPGILQPILTFADFGDLSAWTLNGRAGTIGNPVVDDAGRLVLRLTSSFSESGSAFISNPVPLQADFSFRAFFTFRISLPGGSSDPDGPGADGLAFVVQSVANTAGGLGGGIGYQGIARSVGVEFDTWDNGTWDDFDGNHVGIDVDGVIDSVVQARAPRRMNDGDVWSAWIDYDGRSDRLEARLDASGTRPALPIVAATVDLPFVLQGMDAFVGFTSGTGAAIGAHDILSFVFETYAPVACPNRSVTSVVATFTDECGNGAACERLLWTVDTTGPKLTPQPPLGQCGDTLLVESGPGGSALASPRVDGIDTCGTASVVNDRTLGGADATDVYPCGATPVQFVATDDCGNASSCRVVVTVQPATPPAPVGGVLRVAKDAFSAPILDWSAAPLPPGTAFAVLVSDGRSLPFRLARTGARTWTDAGPTPPIRWYDVRAVDCADVLSGD